MNNFQQDFLLMQQNLIRQIQNKMTISEANQAFDCAYSVVEELHDCLSVRLQMALWLDDPNIFNNPRYTEEHLKIIEEQSIIALEMIQQHISTLENKKKDLINAAMLLKEKIKAAGIEDIMQIEQEFPKLMKLTQLEEIVDEFLQKTNNVLANKQQNTRLTLSL